MITCLHLRLFQTSAVVNKISLAQFYTLFVYFQPLRNNQFDSMSATQGNPCSTFNGKIQLYLIYGILPSKGLTVTYFNYISIECPSLLFFAPSCIYQDRFSEIVNNLLYVSLVSCHDETVFTLFYWNQSKFQH